MASIKEAISSLSFEEQEQVKQYVTSIKEIKKKIGELIAKGKANMQEGGNMSSGLVLHDEE
jgi:uncharacterized protein (DUF1330 family)